MTENTLPDIPQLLKIAEAAANEAGDYLIKKLGQAEVKSSKGLRDDLLDVDLAAEHIIMSKLTKETPNIGILSEEAGFDRKQDTYWIIDPLDGSANFQHGSPTFAVAIALVINLQTAAGVIHIPTRNETFTTIKGQGAYLNGDKIEVSKVAETHRVIIHVGDFTKEDDPETARAGLKDFSNLITRVQRVRMIGTAATDLAYVACGRSDGLINHATSPWDVEAGKLLLIEAGGAVATIQRANSKPLTIYTNQVIHQTIKNLLTDDKKDA